jgi:hypothetical protein
VVSLVVPASCWMPPRDTVVPMSVPPDATASMPPLTIVVLTALPNTTWMPPDDSVVPLAVPASYWVPPLDTTVLTAVPPATTS